MVRRGKWEYYRRSLSKIERHGRWLGRRMANYGWAEGVSVQLKKGVKSWDPKGSITLGYLAHRSRLFFMSILIEFLASHSMLSHSLVTPTSINRLFINHEFCQCPLRLSCQFQIF